MEAGDSQGNCQRALAPSGGQAGKGKSHALSDTPPLDRLTAGLAAALVAAALALPTAVMAQNACNSSICTITLAKVGSPVVDGCGAHATPGRIKITLSSTNSSVTRASFPTAGLFHPGKQYEPNDR